MAQCEFAKFGNIRRQPKNSSLADKSLIGSSLSVHQLLAIALLLAVVIGVISWFYLPLDQFANSNREVPSQPKPDSLQHVNVQPNDSTVNQPYIITTRHRARAEFDDDTIAVPLKSQHDFTVIQVIPKVTYIDVDK